MNNKVIIIKRRVFLKFIMIYNKFYPTINCLRNMMLADCQLEIITFNYS